MSVGPRLSRRKLAGFVADKLQSDDGETALRQAAAYLIETKQTHSARLLVRDIEAALARSGIVVADIISARPLGDEDKSAIAKLFGAKELHTRETIDTKALGGVHVEISGKRLDATLRRKIDLLKETRL